MKAFSGRLVFGDRNFRFRFQTDNFNFSWEKRVHGLKIWLAVSVVELKASSAAGKRVSNHNFACRPKPCHFLKLAFYAEW